MVNEYLRRIAGILVRIKYLRSEIDLMEQDIETLRQRFRSRL